ncbi:DUF2637 domain-containing protein [Micromonospora sp. CA-259024]|uniref:DUF2637 domain-containing protein n=1 Tax=Micromonospora sp. CA-259024 TaxID=3239965 RepID=UPI003D900761
MTPAQLARNVSTAAVATIAAWSSWSHMVHVALRYGERPEIAYVLPISVDGMLIVASAAMVEDNRNERSVRWSARIAFAAGVAASVAANIAAAQPTLGARIVAAWPAVAMLLVVEMLSRAKPPARGQSVTASPNETEKAAEGGPSGTVEESDMKIDQLASGPGRAPAPQESNGPSVGTSNPPRGRRGPAADVVARVRAERPDARFADIAAEAGVSERHVRRLLMSETRRPTTAGSDLDRNAVT